jgi:FMN phosphatase YigB (HAD superfamily)
MILAFFIKCVKTYIREKGWLCSYALGAGDAVVVRGVMFDFGSTLVEDDRFDYFGNLRKAYRVLENAGIAPGFGEFRRVYLQVREELWNNPEFREHTYVFRLAETLKRLGYTVVESDKPLREATDVFLYALVDSLYMKPFIPHMLEELHERYRLGVVSNLGIPEVVPITLEGFGIKQYFDVILASGSVGFRKPSPAIFKEALKALGTLAEETVFVGDSLYHDVQGAKMVGMKAVWLKRNIHHKENINVTPDKIINSLEELPKTLETM